MRVLSSHETVLPTQLPGVRQSVHRVPVLIPYPRDTHIMWSQTVTDRKKGLQRESYSTRLVAFPVTLGGGFSVPLRSLACPTIHFRRKSATLHRTTGRSHVIYGRRGGGGN